jgi:diaminopropionate ammonia-lyase
MRAVVNRAVRPAALPPPVTDALPFHASLPGYAPTPLHPLPSVAAELGVGAVVLKDESARMGLPAFKVLGASWAVERALRENPRAHTLVAASAGNHGRAVAHVAAGRGVPCRIFLPARASAARREAITSEGAQVVVVDGDYDDAVAAARAAAAAGDGVLEIADFGASGPARWAIDGYATLFAETARQGGDVDLVVVPVGGGSLAAAGARFAAQAGASVVGVEPVTAACLAASLAAGEPTAVPTPGTTMAGLDCGELSAAAWPSLRDGVHGTISVDDPEVHEAMRELAEGGLAIGDCGAAALVALRALASERECAELRERVALGPASNVLLVATEGPTDPEGYRAVVG